MVDVLRLVHFGKRNVTAKRGTDWSRRLVFSAFSALGIL